MHAISENDITIRGELMRITFDVGRVTVQFPWIFMQISCKFASDFFEKLLHYCTTIALQKSCDKPANRRVASDEKRTPGVYMYVHCTRKVLKTAYFCTF